MKRSEPRAALIFSDRQFSEMLEGELKAAGFKITNEEKAELILAEADYLPFLLSGKRKIVFYEGEVPLLPQEEECSAFPRLFLVSELSQKLKKIYFEIVAGHERVTVGTKSAEEKNESVPIPMPDGKNVRVGEDVVSLTPFEFKLYSLLYDAFCEGRVLSRERIRDALTGGENKGGNICDVYICHLRKKLETPSGRRLIYTVRGQGYSLLIKEAG